jgi:RNA 3'-terminal phosphate cyclase
MPESVHLEGTTLEGGGQLVRLALSLSALTSTPIKITNIRGNRSGGGGLKQQHLTAVNWLASACGATTSGAEKKNRTLEFSPLKEVTTPLKPSSMIAIFGRSCYKHVQKFTATEFLILILSLQSDDSFSSRRTS